MNYWDFYPAKSPASDGRVPVWGIAKVAASRCAGVAEGRRVYGYFPMSSFVVLRPRVPKRGGSGGFVDVSPHRTGLPAAYNGYTFCDEDPMYGGRDMEDAMMLLRPLFLTSWLLDDFLGVNGLFGAEDVILSSASSKTALGLAFLLSSASSFAGKIIGITSAKNAAFVAKTGYYTDVVSYDDVAAGTGISRSRTAVYVRCCRDAFPLCLPLLMVLEYIQRQRALCYSSVAPAVLRNSIRHS